MRAWAPWVAGPLIVGLGLAALDRRGPPMSGALAYLVLAAILAALTWLIWHWVAKDNAWRWLAAAFLIALGLRLAVGVALTYLLPAFGNDARHHAAGYFYPDAYIRDQDAWTLAGSNRSLADAFSHQWPGDQYGGLLFVSALIYRVLSPDVQRPWLIVLVGAAASAWTVLFGWGFAGMTFGRRAGSIAAWILALFPDSILLAASQMREPYLGLAVAVAFYGYARFRMGSYRSGALTLALAFLIALPLSPPTSIMMMAAVGGAWLWEGRVRGRATHWILLTAVLAALVGFGLTWRSWAQLYAAPSENPIALIRWWLAKGTLFETSKLTSASGWVQEVFRRTPDWSHPWLVTANGITQVFLPAALADNTGLPMARAVIVWRSLGWYFLIPFLIFAIPASFRWEGWRGLPTYLALIIWGMAAFVAYRFGGDQWDNPRYRAVWIALQAALAGWAWVQANRVRSPWLLRSALWVGGLCLIWLHWYVGRYYHTPKLGIWPTLALAGGFALVYPVTCAIIDAFHGRQSRRLTSETPGL